MLGYFMIYLAGFVFATLFWTTPEPHPGNPDHITADQKFERDWVAFRNVVVTVFWPAYLVRLATRKVRSVLTAPVHKAPVPRLGH